MKVHLDTKERVGSTEIKQLKTKKEDQNPQIQNYFAETMLEKEKQARATNIIINEIQTLRCERERDCQIVLQGTKQVSKLNASAR